MFPHKYTDPSDGPIIFAWLYALREWQKTRPLNHASIPRLKISKHPHANDPRVIREQSACLKHYSEIWFNAQGN
jgi:hypothetical protein